MDYDEDTISRLVEIIESRLKNNGDQKPAQQNTFFIPNELKRPKVKPRGVMLSDETYGMLKYHAAINNISVSRLVEYIIRQALDE